MNDLELTFALPHPNPLPQGEGASATLRVLIGLLQ
jgi:hypothetical protein